MCKSFSSSPGSNSHISALTSAHHLGRVILENHPKKVHPGSLSLRPGVKGLPKPTIPQGCKTAINSTIAPTLAPGQPGSPRGVIVKMKCFPRNRGFGWMDGSRSVAKEGPQGRPWRCTRRPFVSEGHRQDPSGAIFNFFSSQNQRLAKKLFQTVLGQTPLLKPPSLAAAAGTWSGSGSTLSNTFVPRGTGKFLGTFALFTHPSPPAIRKGGRGAVECQPPGSVPPRWAPTGLVCRHSSA